MELSLTDEMTSFIQERIRGGRYGAPEDVVRAGLEALRRQESLQQLQSAELGQWQGECRSARRIADVIGRCS